MGLKPSFPGHPRQGWQWTITVDGFDAAVFQKVTLPEVSTEIDTFASGGSIRDEKFAGRKTIGDCTLEKGMFADNGDMAAWNWLTAEVNTATGNQGLPADYRKTVVISHVDRLGRVTQKWTLYEAFVSKLAWSDGEGTNSEHMVETLTLTVGDVLVTKVR